MSNSVVLTRREKRLSWALAIGVAIILAMVVTPVVDRRLPREVILQPVVSPVVPGQDLRLLLNIYPYFYCPAEVEEATIDAKSHKWPVDRRAGVANGTEPSLTNATPYARFLDIATVKMATPGPARYESDVYYYCSWWQRHFFPLHVHRVVHFVFKAPAP